MTTTYNYSAIIRRPATTKFNYTAKNIKVWPDNSVEIEHFGLNKYVYEKLQVALADYKVYYAKIKKDVKSIKSIKKAKIVKAVKAEDAFFDIVINEHEFTVDEFRIHGARAILYYHYSTNMHENLEDILEMWECLLDIKFPDSGDLMALMEGLNEKQILKLTMNI